MEIRYARKEDVPMMKEIFEMGRMFQLKAGNPKQWEKGYPSKELILEDISKKRAYVCTKDGEMVGVFSLFAEPVPIYSQLDGQWLNDEQYVSIQRIASNGKVKGIGKHCIKWVQENHDNIRLTTHEKNGAMKKILNDLDFQHRGVLHWENGTPRNAYHYVKSA